MQVFDSGKLILGKCDMVCLGIRPLFFVYFEDNLFNPFIQAQMFELDKMMKLLLH